MLVDPAASEPQIVAVPAGARHLADLVLRLVDALARMGARAPGAAAEVEALLADPLLTGLVEPILDWLPPGDAVYLVPHGPLHRVPLHAVPVGGVCLADRNAVAYLPSASVLRFCRTVRRPGPPRSALVVADPPGPRPLAFGPAHESALRDRFDYEVLRGPAADRAALIGRFAAGAGAAVPDVLHVNAHGVAEAKEVTPWTA